MPRSPTPHFACLLSASMCHISCSSPPQHLHSSFRFSSSFFLACALPFARALLPFLPPQFVGVGIPSTASPSFFPCGFRHFPPPHFLCLELPLASSLVRPFFPPLPALAPPALLLFYSLAIYALASCFSFSSVSRLVLAHALWPIDPSSLSSPSPSRLRLSTASRALDRARLVGGPLAPRAGGLRQSLPPPAFVLPNHPRWCHFGPRAPFLPPRLHTPAGRRLAGSRPPLAAPSSASRDFYIPALAGFIAGCVAGASSLSSRLPPSATFHGSRLLLWCGVLPAPYRLRLGMEPLLHPLSHLLRSDDLLY